MPATPIFGLLLVLAPPADLAPRLAAPIVLDVEVAGEVAAAHSEREARARRARIASVHRAFGVATFVAMVATIWLGDLQYYDRYGLFDAYDETPCARGDTVLGYCDGAGWPHVLAASVTGALYATTATLSVLMPAPPGDEAEGDSAWARALRQHRALRWVHLTGIVVQALLGPLIANPGLLGLDRREDHRLLQGLATAHFGVGVVTATALGWAAWLMLF